MHEVGPVEDRIDRLRSWIRGREKVGSHVREVGILAGDLDGILESAEDISTLIPRALTSSSVELDEMLIELQIAVDHLNFHWSSLRKTNWPIDDELF